MLVFVKYAEVENIINNITGANNKVAKTLLGVHSRFFCLWKTNQNNVFVLQKKEKITQMGD